MGFKNFMKKVLHWTNNKEDAIKTVEYDDISNNIDYNVTVNVPLNFYQQPRTDRLNIRYYGKSWGTCKPEEVDNVKEDFIHYNIEGKNINEIEELIRTKYSIKPANNKKIKTVRFKKNKNNRLGVLYQGRQICSCYPNQKREVTRLIKKLENEGKSFNEIKQICSKKYNLKKGKKSGTWNRLKWNDGRLYFDEENTGIVAYDLNDIESIIANSENTYVTRKCISALPFANKEILVFLINNYKTMEYANLKKEGLNELQKL